MNEKELKEFCVEHRLKLLVFLDEIEIRARYVMNYKVSFERGLSLSSADLIWASIYSITVFTAQISKCLGGSEEISLEKKLSGSKKHQKLSTRLALRLLLKVEDNHPVLDTSLRNRFIHMDEDIDEFFENGETIVARRNVSPIDTIMLKGENTSKYSFEHYDPDTGQLYYRGNEYSLPDIFNGISDILSRLDGAKSILKELSETK